ncbi:MAG: hypothetical protein M1837_005701 [Sclerophora amabilis]|nr:MAG: hypothetical protein M1837_005701 [Sclerophora amabilis]
MAPPESQSCILVLGLPPSSLCGIDLLSFTPSPRFHGIKQVPAGWHFLFTGSTTSLSIRHGEWLQIAPQSTGSDAVATTESVPNDLDLHIRRWNPSTETLVDDQSPAQIQQWRSRITTVWKEGLTPYRQSATAGDGTANSALSTEDTRDWHRLTEHITPSLLNRITDSHDDPIAPRDWRLTSASSASRDMDDIPGLSDSESATRQLEEKELAFLPIDLKQTWRAGAVGRERTEAAQDRSWALGEVLGAQQTSSNDDTGEDGDGETALLGEMQLTFLMVLTLGNYSCLEQWKRILGLVFTCRAAVRERPGLFVRFLKLLFLQLRHCGDVDGGLFDLSDEGGALLRGLLKGFRRSLEDLAEIKTLTPSEPDKTEGTTKRMVRDVRDVRDQYQDLETYVRAEFGWELSDSYVRRGMLELEDGEQVEMEVDDLEGEDERGDYAPVVVDLGDTDITTP